MVVQLMREAKLSNIIGSTTIQAVCRRISMHAFYFILFYFIYFIYFFYFYFILLLLLFFFFFCSE